MDRYQAAIDEIKAVGEQQKQQEYVERLMRGDRRGTKWTVDILAEDADGAGRVAVRGVGDELAWAVTEAALKLARSGH